MGDARALMTWHRGKDTILEGSEERMNQDVVHQQRPGLREKGKPGEPQPVAPRANPSEKHPGPGKAGATPGSWDWTGVGVGARPEERELLALGPSLLFLSGEQGKASVYLGGKKRIQTLP